MSIGGMDRRIQFKRLSATDDGFTSGGGSFVDLGAPVWASRKDVSDSERFGAGEVAASITSRFVVRSSAFTRGIKPSDRFEAGGMTYNIVGIKEIGRLDRLEITAAARSD